MDTEPGIYRACWQRGAGTATSDFFVVVGILTVNGPRVDAARSCDLTPDPTDCTVQLDGVGLTDDGRLAVMHSCAPGGVHGDTADVPASVQATFVSGFAATSVPRVPSQGNTGVHYFSLGEIQVGDVVPGTYALCWCSSAACSEASDFQAYAGALSLNCAPGYYLVDASEPRCVQCHQAPQPTYF